jgi:anti-sigma-K factor RskA
MTDERLEELAALAALGLLEGAELAEFEAALAQFPHLQQKAGEWQEAAACLCHMAPSAHPPPDLRTRILQSIADSKKADRPQGRVFAFPALIPWAIAACFAVVAAWSGERYVAARSENLLLRDEQKLADLELQRVRNQIAEERIVSQREIADSRRQLDDSGRQLADLADQLSVANNLMRLKAIPLGPTPGTEAKAQAVALWDFAKQQGILEVMKLPALAPGKDYQLWAIDPQYGKPVSSGVFQVDPVTCTACISFKTGKAINAGSRFAVSLERKGGVPSPEGPIVLLSD